MTTSINLLDVDQLNHLRVDAQSGNYMGTLKLARLNANKGMGPSFDLQLELRPNAIHWQFAASRAFVPLEETPKNTAWLRLANGQAMPLNGSTDLGFAKVIQTKEKITIFHKDGTIEELKNLFDKHPGKSKHDAHFIVDSITTPLGYSLKFAWNSWMLGTHLHLTLDTISDDKSTLVKGDDVNRTLPSKLTVFPDSDESMTYCLEYSSPTLSFKKLLDAEKDKKIIGLSSYTLPLPSPDALFPPLVAVSLSGATPDNKRTLNYDSDGYLVEVKTAHGSAEKLMLTADEDATAKVISHTQSFDAGLNLDSVVTVYSFNKDTPDIKLQETILTVTQGGNTEVIQHIYNYDETLQLKVTAKNGIASNEAMKFSTDAYGTCTTSQINTQGAASQTTTLVIDASSNTLSIKTAALQTHYSYYPSLEKVVNIQTDSNEKIEQTGFYATLLRPLDSLIPDRRRKEGFTWNRKFTKNIFTAPASINYAKSLFKLPIELSYPGDANLFSRHPASEYQEHTGEDGVTTILSANFFGYTSLSPKGTVGNLTNSSVVVPSHLLTVRAPDADTLSIQEKHLDVLTTVLAPTQAEELKALRKTLKDNPKESKPFKTAQEKILNMLKAFSSAQSAPTLKSFKKHSMSVTETTYCTDNTKDDFGRIKEIAIYLLDEKGNEIAKSKSTTTYSYDLADNVTTTQTFKADGISLKTIECHSQHSGRLLTRTYPDGRQEAHTYDVNGLISVIETRGTNTNTNAFTTEMHTPKEEKTTYIKKTVSQKDETTYSLLDSLGRTRSTWQIFKLETTSTNTKKTYKNEDKPLSQTTYTASGRISEHTEYDYKDGAQDCHSQKLTYQYPDALTCVGTLTLAPPTGKVLDSVSQTLKFSVDGTQTLTQKLGDIEVKDHSRFDPILNKLTEWSETSKTAETAPLRKRETQYTKDGRVRKIAWIEYTRKGDKTSDPTEVDAQKFDYDAWGRVTKIARSNLTISYTYDVAGRLTEQTSADRTLYNTYAEHSLLPLAINCSISGKDKVKVTTGTYTYDGLGRVLSAQCGNSKFSYSYLHDQRWGRRTSESTPEATDGFFSSSSPTTELKETFGDRSTSSHYSLRGRLLSDKNILNSTTNYEYDTLGRLKKSASGLFESAFSYHIDGSIKSESIYDALSKQKLIINSTSAPYSATTKTSSVTRLINVTEDSYGIDTLNRYLRLSTTRNILGQITEINHNLSHSAFNLGEISPDFSDVNTLDYSEQFTYTQQGYFEKWTYALVHQELKNTKGEWLRTFNAIGDLEKYTHSYTRTYIMPGYNDASYIYEEYEKNKDKSEKQVTDTYEFAYDTRTPFTLTSMTLKTSSTPEKKHTFTYNDKGQMTNNSLFDRTFNSKGLLVTSGVCTFSYDEHDQIRQEAFGKTPFRQFHYRNGKPYAVHKTKARSRLFLDNEYISQSSQNIPCDSHLSVFLNESSSCLLQRSIITASDNKTETTRFYLMSDRGVVVASLPSQRHYEGRQLFSPTGHSSFNSNSLGWLGHNQEIPDSFGLYHPASSGRVYDPTIGAFESEDPTSPAGGGGAHPKLYCGNDPINFTDPDGYARLARTEEGFLSTPIMYDRKFQAVAFSMIAVTSLPLLALAPNLAGAGFMKSLAVGVAFEGTITALNVSAAWLEENDRQTSDNFQKAADALMIFNVLRGHLSSLGGASTKLGSVSLSKQRFLGVRESTVTLLTHIPIREALASRNWARLNTSNVASSLTRSPSLLGTDGKFFETTMPRSSKAISHEQRELLYLPLLTDGGTFEQHVKAALLQREMNTSLPERGLQQRVHVLLRQLKAKHQLFYSSPEGNFCQEAPPIYEPAGFEGNSLQQVIPFTDLR